MADLKNLDFKESELVGSTREVDFTKRASQKFQDIVHLEDFMEEDAEVIFNYLFKEIELVSFGDYLKRYIYERAGIDEPFNKVPIEVFKEIAVDSFKETKTPKSMQETSTKLSTLINNWLTQSSIKRENIFLLGFGLNMTTDDVSEFLTKVSREQDFDFKDPKEVIYWFCIGNHLPYSEAEKLIEEYEKIEPQKPTKLMTNRIIRTKEQLMEYLANLKYNWVDPSSESSEAFKEFLSLYNESRDIIAEIYQGDEEELGRKKTWDREQISPSDVEKVICSGIPVNDKGNLTKISASILSRHFSQKRFTRQRITNILANKFPVERFDLITLKFFVVSQKLQDVDTWDRYRRFVTETNQILKKCNMGELYIVNPYECFLLLCLLTDCPLAVFSEIWERSYEE